MSGRAIPSLLAAAALLALPSCVNLSFDRDVDSETIGMAEVGRITPGTASLLTCLGEFGAPTIAFEDSEQRFSLAWAWGDAFDWGVSVSLPLRFGANLSYKWSDAQLDFPAVLVLFDQHQIVQQIRTGTLRDLTKGLARTRSAAIDE